jgi:peptidyl-tRNA hydrolase
VDAPEQPRAGRHADPIGEPPWGMQLVVHVPKIDPPTHLAVCEATAAAVVSLLADPRAQPDGEWHERVRRWEDGRIRKVVRRARGAPWRATEQLDQVTIDRRGAQVRAFVPGPVDAVPPELAKLQVAGTDLEEQGEPSPADDDTLCIAATPRARMSTGKAAAQCGHAAQLAWTEIDDARRAAWVAAGLPVSVSLPDRRRWRRLTRTAPVRVVDAGFTEIPPGTTTTVAWFA